MELRKVIPVIAGLVLSFSCNLMDVAKTPIPTVVPIPVQTSIPTVEPIPTQTQEQKTGSIGGVIWHEICEFTGGEAGQPVELGKGCVQWGTGPADFGANQVQDDFEKGWANVTLHLGMGKCPSTGLMTAKSENNGRFQFSGLKPGTYCVSYSNLTDGNDKLLIPGVSTFPARDETGFSISVDLLSGEEKMIKFGYAGQNY